MRTLTFEYSNRSVPVYLDLCLPDTEGTEPLPVFLWFHGGGLIQGSRQSMPPHLKRAVDKYGIAVVTTDYRLAPQVRVPEIQRDMVDCLVFVLEKLPAILLKREEKIRLDVNRVVLSGSSAGGWQALMLGLGMCADTNVSHLRKIKGIAVIYPITTMDHPFFLEKQIPFGGYISESSQSFAQYRDPTTPVVTNTMTLEPRKKFYMHAQQEALFPSLLFDDQQRAQGWLQKTDVAVFLQQSTQEQRNTFPPIYVIHGAKDTAVDVDQARRVVLALHAIRATVVYDEVPDKDHLWDSFEPQEDLDQLYDFTMQSLKS